MDKDKGLHQPWKLARVQPSSFSLGNLEGVLQLERTNVYYDMSRPWYYCCILPYLPYSHSRYSTIIHSYILSCLVLSRLENALLHILIPDSTIRLQYPEPPTTRRKIPDTITRDRPPTHLQSKSHIPTQHVTLTIALNTHHHRHPPPRNPTQPSPNIRRRHLPSSNLRRQQRQPKPRPNLSRKRTMSSQLPQQLQFHRRRRIVSPRYLAYTQPIHMFMSPTHPPNKTNHLPHSCCPTNTFCQYADNKQVGCCSALQGNCKGSLSGGNAYKSTSEYVAPASTPSPTIYVGGGGDYNPPPTTTVVQQGGFCTTIIAEGDNLPTVANARCGTALVVEAGAGRARAWVVGVGVGVGLQVLGGWVVFRRW